MAADPVLDSVRCPGCLSVCDVQSGEDDGESWQIAACSGCGYEMDPAGVITVRQMLDGAETGSTWTDVDLPAWTRMIAQALRGVAAGPQATPDQEPVCGGFVWIGQPMTSCDRCGQPAWEHEGLDQPTADPFSDALSTVRPWKPGEAEAIRAKWGGSSTVHMAEVRRPIPGARDMTGDVHTDHEDQPDG